MSGFKHGQRVSITDAYGVTTVGTLHLPDLEMSGPKVATFFKPRVLDAGYGVATLILDNGNRFRTEGRLSRVAVGRVGDNMGRA